MTRYFAQNTPRAGLEHMMMSVPGFQKRGGGMMILSRFCYKPEDVDCRYCLHYRRRSCQVRTCPYIAERLKSGAIEYLDLILEYFGHIPHAGLHKRIQAVEHWSGPDQAVLHTVSVHLRSRFADRVWDDAPPGYLAALYLLASKERLWQPALSALSHDSIDFSCIVSKPHGFAIQDYAAFHIRENGHDSIFSTGNGEEFLDVAIRLRRYLQGGAESVKGDFSHHFYKAQPITRERFDELATLRMENIGKVSGAFEIDMDAAWISSLLIMDGWHTFKIKDVSAAVYHATRSLHVPLEYQWHKFINHLDGKQIEPESFASAEIGGLRPLEKGDILCIDGPFPTDRELKFRLDLSSYGVQKEVLNLMTDCSKPENSLEITCSYDAARQGISNKLDLTLRQKNGMVRHDFFYPLMEEERAHLLTHVCLNRQANGLSCGSVILLEQLRTIDKSRLRERVGALDTSEMKQIDWALGVSVGLAEGYR